jgi:hypothetical protein
VLKEVLMVTGAQQLEEIYNLHIYKITFIINIIGFGVTGYLKRYNNIRENSVDMVFINFW